MKAVLNLRHQVVDGVFLITLLAVLGWLVVTTLSTVNFGGSVDKNRLALGELLQGVIVRQVVPVQEVVRADTVCYDVLFATYRRKNPCQLQISLIQGGYNHSFRLDASVLLDNKPYSLCFPMKGLLNGKATLEIAGIDGKALQSPTVWMTSDIPYGGAVHNGMQIERGLIFKVYAKRHLGRFLGWFGSLFLVCGLSVSTAAVRYPEFRHKIASGWKRFRDQGQRAFFKTPVDSRQWIFVFSMMAWTLSVVMATVSQFAAHPDEGMHSASATYYESHSIPPAVGDPEGRPTYISRYGVSYVNQSGIDYFLIGKFSNIIKSIVSLKRFYLHRCFNVLLFLALCFIIWKSENRLIFFPLVITSQVWYIASYTNNDFFPFVIMMVLCFEFLDGRSFFRRAFKGDSVLYSIPAGVTLGILSISKTNYLVFVLFAGCYLFWKAVKSHYINMKWHLALNSASKSVLLILLCVLSVYSIRTGFDIYQNGFDKNEKLKHYANQVAAKGFRPVDIETDIQNTDPGLRLKDKGISLVSLLTEKGWHITSLKSFFGVYGWMKIKASKSYYIGVSFLICLLLIYMGIQAISTLEAENIIFVMVAFLFICLMMAISLYYSWTYAYQPQGRYLFPILGILSVLIHESQGFLNRHILNLLIILMFAFSFWSFVFVGIYHIEKMI